MINVEINKTGEYVLKHGVLSAGITLFLLTVLNYIFLVGPEIKVFTKISIYLALFSGVIGLVTYSKHRRLYLGLPFMAAFCV